MNSKTGASKHNRIVIFLDIDGVLCTPRVCVASEDRGINSTFDPVACQFLDRICRDNDIRIVISSVWSIGRTVGHFADIFGAMGYHHVESSLFKDWADYEKENFPWTTPNMPGIRGLEIAQWLGENESKWDNYLILDDDSDMTEEQLENHFIHCSTRDGLSFKNMVDILNFLKDINDL